SRGARPAGRDRWRAASARKAGRDAAEQDARAAELGESARRPGDDPIALRTVGGMPLLCVSRPEKSSGVGRSAPAAKRKQEETQALTRAKPVAWTVVPLRSLRVMAIGKVPTDE